MGKKASNRLNTERRGDLQLSSVLPITTEDYALMLQRIQSQTSFQLQKSGVNIIKQTIVCEGASSPFVARLLIGIPTLRDAIFHNQSQSKRDEFDRIFHPMAMKLLNLKSTTQEILKLLSDHSEKISQKEITHIEDNSIRIDESIDQKLKKNVNSFINEASRIFKQEMQSLTKFLDIHIGFLYQKPDSFLKGLTMQNTSDSNFASYLGETRKWSEKLTEIRNKIEHEWWELPNVTYKRNGDSVTVNEPSVLEQPVSVFVVFILERLSCFVEEVTVHCIQKKMPDGISFLEIPPSERNLDMPLRFRVATVMSNITPWSINYSDGTFEQK